MNKYIKLASVLLVLTGFVGCTTRIGDFTVISTKNCDVAAGGKYIKKGSFEGDDMALMIIVIPTGFPNLKTAVDKCIEAGDGDLITNAVLSSKFWWAVLVGSSGYEVKGDVWRSASRSDIENPNIQKYTLVETPQGRQLVSDLNPSERLAVLDSNNPNSYTIK
ncbi:MAG TPA: hypothetical protein VEW28_10330 [Candidatus Kapabacteria bacterium]|nr:hypothetical protein [Candidatus Kapabacteria bacterium]